MNDKPAYDFDERIQSHVKFFDEVLAALGHSGVFKNPDFEFGKDGSGFGQALFDVRSTTQANAVGMWLHFTTEGIRLDLDGMNELFEWSADEIYRSPQKISEFLIRIFTGYILIETRGGKRFLEIFDSQGQFFEWTSYNDFLHMLTGMHIAKYKTDRRLFLPFYA